jgi:hypothetical protein
MDLLLWTSVVVAVGVGLADVLSRPRGGAPVIRYRG